MTNEFKWYCKEELEWIINWIYYKFITDSNSDDTIIGFLWSGSLLWYAWKNEEYRYTKLDEIKDFIKTELFLSKISEKIKKSWNNTNMIYGLE